MQPLIKQMVEEALSIRLPDAEKPPVDGARKAADGSWYLDDPNRQGKYLQVQPGQGQPQRQPAMPQVGEVQEGHRFLGGHPGHPENWQRLAA
jgi:hypothetical protein